MAGRGGARLRNEPITLTCGACSGPFSYLKAGQLPKLCAPCGSTLRWCPTCKAAKPLGSFFSSQGPGHACKACCARPKRQLECAGCGVAFERTHRGGRTKEADRKHLCDHCELELKWCATCGLVLPVDSFNKSTEKRDGRMSRCNPCAKARYAERTERDRRAIVVKKYGITLAEWDAMYLAQAGLCASCNQPPDIESRGLVVDHNHATGAVRALLCSKCNLGLGHFMDDPRLLRLAADYLERMEMGEHRGL